MPNEVVPSDAVRAIQDSVKTETLAIDGVRYATRPVFAPPIETKPETMGLHTLSGLVDYLRANIDELNAAKHAIHIESHDTVTLVGQLAGRPSRRDEIVSAHFDSLKFAYGHWYSCEEFNIALQALFMDSEDRATVLKVVGNIKEEAVGQYDDDGVSQSVTARAGVARVAEIAVPNPVTLRPYRTFAEVEQPASPFVLRLKRSKEGEMPTCALFEADGGKWKVAAIQNIARSLRVLLAELPEDVNKTAIIA